jgi:outer membrane protein OmpA-like peptidoglycan-associated protein
MKYIVAVLVVLICVPVFAQTNEKAQKAYDNAMQQLNDGFVKDAIPLLGKAIEYDHNFLNAYLSLAGVYAELKDYAKSIEYYDIVKAKDSGYFKYYYLPYSINFAGLGRFQEALDNVNRFLLIPNLGDRSIKSAEYRKRCYQFALDYAAHHPATNYVFTPVNLGDNINTKYSEYYPSITIDDSLFVFTRRGDGYVENFIESRMLNDTTYARSKIIDGTINNEPSKGAINISQDGDWLLFAGNFGRKGYGDFDIYISYNTPTGWSEPINLGPNINTEFYETSPSLSPDKNTLYFCSTRPGGYGGADLYVSHRSVNGKWSPAQNMGPLINTAGDEKAPFIHADGTSLYFTSDGLPGYGNSDLYLTRRLNDSTFTTPENLGYPINTIENEGSLFVAADGVHAYYASDRVDSRGGLDLYRFELRPDVRPVKTLYVKGYVYDAINNKKIPCTVDLTDDSTRQLVTKIQTDETGFYFMTLPVGRNYTFTVNRKGYLFYTDVFALQSKAADSTYTKDIPLQPIAVNASVVLKNIQFDLNSYHLKDVSLIELNKLVQLMTDNASTRIEISGHTDNTGNDADNIKLSTNRAKAVADYLISKGIDAKRLSWKGYGSTKPIADNNTEEGKTKNRRTEFKIIAL